MKNGSRYTSLKQKLFYIVYFVLVLAVTLSFGGYYAVKQYVQAFNTLYTEYIEQRGHLHGAESAMWRLRAGAGAEEVELVHRVEEEVGVYSATRQNAAEINLVAEFGRVFGQYKAARQKAVELMQAGKANEAAQWRSGTVSTKAQDASRALEALAVLHDEGASKTKGALDATNAFVGKSLSIFILFALTTLFSFFYYIARSVARQLISVSSHLAGAAAQLEAASAEQEATAAHQASGIEESSRTVVSLLESASHIADTAGAVLSNAERTRATTETTSTRIIELNTQANRMGEILEAIREIADRTDLLALNASLEASRAGEEGRSFSLLASEMRKLAERVMLSVKDVKALVGDVRASGSSTVMATEEARKLADGTTESARQITLVTSQQRTATEQVAENMRTISGSLNQALAAAKQTRASAGSLREQALELSSIIGLSAGPKNGTTRDLS